MEEGLKSEVHVYSIMRKAVLMEDGGRVHLIKTVTTEKEARDWIAEQQGEYFSPGDYYIMFPVREET